MKLTFLGQNCFLIDYKGKIILTDPFYSAGQAKTGFDIAAQQVDYILLTHAHGDHMADVEAVLEAHPQVVVIGTPELCGHFRGAASIDYNIGGTIKVDDLHITMVRADHTSSFPNGSYGGVPVGYLIGFEGKILYLAGDTGVFGDMQLLPELFGEITAAILPVGGHYTMDARQAAYAADRFLKVKRVIGCHFDTFPPITIDHAEAQKHFAAKAIDFTLPELGQQLEI